MDDTQYNNEPSTTKGLVWEVVKFFLIAAVIVVPIRLYVAQPFLVEGPSMEPTFHSGDYLVVEEISYKTGNPERGDVVVAHNPNHPQLFLIKRVIGLPQETVVVENGTVTITSTAHPDGLELTEPYIGNIRGTPTTEQLGPNEYFLMGDNRAQSSDSRTFGPVTREAIEGQVFLRLFPFRDIGFRPGDYHTYQ